MQNLLYSHQEKYQLVSGNYYCYYCSSNKGDSTEADWMEAIVTGASGSKTSAVPPLTLRFNFKDPGEEAKKKAKLQQLILIIITPPPTKFKSFPKRYI